MTKNLDALLGYWPVAAFGSIYHVYGPLDWPYPWRLGLLAAGACSHRHGESESFMKTRPTLQPTVRVRRIDDSTYRKTLVRSPLDGSCPLGQLGCAAARSDQDQASRERDSTVLRESTICAAARATPPPRGHSPGVDASSTS